MISPLNITVFDGSFNQLAFLNDVISAEMTPRHLAVGTADLYVPANHKKLDLIAQQGNRLVIEYRGEQLMSGPIRRFRVSGTDKSGTAQIGIDDDFRLFYTWLAWIRPDLAVGSQNTGGFKEDKTTGPAETVIKYFVGRNLRDRLGRPVTVATDLGRGGTVTVGLRMVPGADKLITVAQEAGLGITIKQQGAGFSMDVYQPRTFPHTLSEGGGTVISYDYGWDAPTATRTVVGNALEGTLREFVLRSDAAAEALWHDVVEVFTSASDTEVTAEAQARGDATLADSRATSGLSVVLTESKHFRYGGADGVRVGDMVPFRVRGGPVFTDVLKEAKIVWNRDKGLSVTPTLGGWSANPDQKFFKMIRKMQQGLRLLQAK